MIASVRAFVKPTLLVTEAQLVAGVHDGPGVGALPPPAGSTDAWLVSDLPAALATGVTTTFIVLLPPPPEKLPL